jgi:hypothetical protein
VLSQVRVAPRSHGRVKRGDARPRATRPAQRLDPGGDLRLLPLAVTEVVQVEVAAASAEKSSGLCGVDGWRSIACGAIACSQTARRLASVLVGEFDKVTRERPR